MSTYLRITGVEEIKRLLNQLEQSLRTKILRNALQKTAKPILKDAESNVWKHQVSGRLYRSLGIQVGKGKLGIPEVTIGARTGGKFKGHHAHLLENGTAERTYKTKTGKTKSTGRVQGVKFWEDAISSNEDKVSTELQNNIIKAMQQEANKIIKKSLK